MRAVLFLTPLLLALAVAGCRFEPRAESPPVATPSASVETPSGLAPPSAPVQMPTEAGGDKPEVVLYVTEWCPYCAQAREYMTAENIPHRVVDIETSAQASAEYQRMGGTGGIPLVAVGTETIEGWSAEAARQMLDAAGYD